MRDNIRLDVIHDDDTDDGLGAARGLVNALAGTLLLTVFLAMVWVILAVF